MWTLVSGSLDINAPSVVGTVRVSDPNAHPGARRFTACWKDNNGHLWLYGGNNGGYIGDTWRYDGTNWAYWGGPTDYGVAPVNGTPKTFSFDYHPGGRGYAGVAVTASGSATYIIGGLLNFLYSADIWKFESDKGWSFWDGYIGAQHSTPGTIKVPSETNKLDSRYGSATVVDDFDNIWIFGGYGYQAPGILFDHLNLLKKVI
jgi:hypothetical protein